MAGKETRMVGPPQSSMGRVESANRSFPIWASSRTRMVGALRTKVKSSLLFVSHYEIMQVVSYCRVSGQEAMTVRCKSCLELLDRQFLCAFRGISSDLNHGVIRSAAEIHQLLPA